MCAFSVFLFVCFCFSFYCPKNNQVEENGLFHQQLPVVGGILAEFSVGRIFAAVGIFKMRMPVTQTADLGCTYSPTDWTQSQD